MIKGNNPKIMAEHKITAEQNFTKTIFCILTGKVNRNSALLLLYSSVHNFMVIAGIITAKIYGCIEKSENSAVSFALKKSLK